MWGEESEIRSKTLLEFREDRNYQSLALIIPVPELCTVILKNLSSIPLWKRGGGKDSKADVTLVVLDLQPFV